VSTLNRQNDDLLLNTVQLETQLNKSKQKIFGTEEQLRKLEHKVSISDVSIANQVCGNQGDQIGPNTTNLSELLSDYLKSDFCPSIL
jgi:hypothetical protein